VIDGALKALNDGYVFPDVAKKMEQAVPHLPTSSSAKRS
jgi:hypothetical protein